MWRCCCSRGPRRARASSSCARRSAPAAAGSSRRCSPRRSCSAAWPRWSVSGAAHLACATGGVHFLEVNLGRLPFWYDLRLSPATVLFAARAHRARLRDRGGDACAQGDARHGIPAEAGRGRSRRTAVRRRLDRGDRRAGRDHGGISRGRLRRAVGVAPHPDVRGRIRRRGVSGRADRDGCADCRGSERRFGPPGAARLVRARRRGAAPARGRGARGGRRHLRRPASRARPVRQSDIELSETVGRHRSVGRASRARVYDRRSARRLSRPSSRRTSTCWRRRFLRVAPSRRRSRARVRASRSSIRASWSRCCRGGIPSASSCDSSRMGMRPPSAPIPGSRSSAS